MSKLSYWLTALLTILIIALTIFLRFYQLGDIPHGINVDEASYGYDSYSLLKTGKDMWGETGSSLKSFGDYKPAGLSYTLVPVIKYFGLSTFATRLPSAIFGLLTLVVTFYLIRFLLNNTPLALLGSIILGLSPWHFGLSRLFYEPNTGLFFLLCGIFLQLKFIKQPTNIKYLILSAFFIAIGGYYYSALRYLGIGFLGITTIITYYPNYGKIIKHFFLALFFWVLVAFPYIGDMIGSKGLIRLNQENALHTFGNTLVITENRQMCFISSGRNTSTAKLCYSIWNKPGEKLVNTAKAYIRLLSPNYLFLSGHQKDVVPENSGAFLVIFTPFYFLGLFYLISNMRKKKEYLYILISWLFAAIPVAMVIGINIHRNVVGLYFAFLIIVYGIYFTIKLLSMLSSRTVKLAIITIISLGYIWLQSRYIANYYFVYTNMQPETWLYDTPEVMMWLGENNKNRKINFYDYEFAPLFYSFYNQLDPNEFQRDAVWNELNQYGWTHVNRIGDTIKNRANIWDTICLHQDNEEPSQLLVVSGAKSEWSEVVEKQFKNFTEIHTTHEIYDSRVLYDYLFTDDSKSLSNRCLLLDK